MPLRPLVVVMADDDPDTVWTVSMILRDEGHEVHGLSRGDAVAGTVRRQRPDVVILDIEMPGLSGYAVAQEIRKGYVGRAAPLLIAISGKWNSQTDVLLARTVGFDHFLRKPCDPRELVELLAPLRLQRR